MAIYFFKAKNYTQKFFVFYIDKNRQIIYIGIVAVGDIVKPFYFPVTYAVTPYVIEVKKLSSKCSKKKNSRGLNHNPLL